MPSADRWPHVERIFYEALERPSAERSRFVAAACGSDGDLRQEVESLLANESRVDWQPSIADAVAADWTTAAGFSLVNRVIDGFRVLSPIGAGGMGEVVLAEQVSLDRKVALKLLPAAHAADAGRLHRFADEARAVSALNHPGIVTVYHVGEVDGRPYLATEFVDGETLRARLRAGPLTLDEAIDIAVQVANALAAAHDTGIVHRDVKPENIMIRPDGLVKVLDFGLAKLARRPDGEPRRPGITDLGAVLGTADYMAPEQAAGAAVDARADIYSLAVVVHEMITGNLPRERAGGTGGISPGGSPLPRSAWPVLGRALASDPAARYQRIGDFRSDLLTVRPRPGRSMWRRSLVALSASIALLALGGLATRWIKARSPAVVATAPTALAVLPFQTIGFDEAQQYLGVGLADAVITQLGGLSGITIRPTSSIRGFTQPNLDLIAAGHTLAVDNVLGGLVQRSGDRMRVTVQLMDVRTGAQRWAGRIDVSAADLFSLQDVVSQRVAAALEQQLSAADRGTLTPHQTTNPEAYQLYLRGRYYLARVDREDVERSLTFFEQAVALDPRYALAHAGIAVADRTLAMTYTPGASTVASMQLARQAAQTALELDPDIADAYSVLGTVRYQFDHDWNGAAAALTRAIALGPNNADVHREYGWYLAALGRRDESIAELRRAAALGPTEPLTHENFGIVLEFAGRSAEALEQVDAAIRLDPVSTRPLGRRIWMLEVHGRFQEALATRQAAWRLMHRDDEATRLGDLFAAGSYHAIFEDDVRPSARKDAIAAAWAHVQLGDPARALDELDRAERERHTWCVVINVDPRFVSLHQQPRFEALLRRIGLR